MRDLFFCPLNGFELFCMGFEFRLLENFRIVFWTTSNLVLCDLICRYFSGDQDRLFAEAHVVNPHKKSKPQAVCNADCQQFQHELDGFFHLDHAVCVVWEGEL